MRTIALIAAFALLTGCGQSKPTEESKPAASIAKKEEDPPLPKPIRGCKTSCKASALSEFENCKRNAAKVGADPWRCQVEYDQKVSDCNDNCAP